MSRLLVITRSSLVSGFHLAGVDAFPADDVETAQELIIHWLETGEKGLLAIDSGLLAQMTPAFLRRLQAAEQLPFLAIPGGDPSAVAVSRRERIAELVRRSVGIHITFQEKAGQSDDHDR